MAEQNVHGIHPGTTLQPAAHCAVEQSCHLLAWRIRVCSAICLARRRTSRRPSAGIYNGPHMTQLRHSSERTEPNPSNRVDQPAPERHTFERALIQGNKSSNKAEKAYREARK